MTGLVAKPARTTDWEGVEREYRAGIRTTRDIGGEFGVSHTAINKRASRDGWTRDIAAKIKAKADELVSRAAVSKEVSKEEKVSERLLVETNATMQANIILAQRKDISRGRALSTKLFQELEAVTDNKELFDQVAELLHAPDEKGNDRLNELYRKVIDLPSRIDGAKKLAETLRILIDAERKAAGIKDDADEGGSADDFIERLRKHAGNG